MNTRVILLCGMLAWAVSTTAQDQQYEPRWSVKNNLLYDVTLTPNIGVEVVTGSRSSVQLFYGLHPWTFGDDKKLRHWSIMPEWRRWIQEKGPLSGWFWGIHGVAGEFNTGGVELPFGLLRTIRDNRYEGSFAGGGLTVGHAWPLGSRWRIEAAIGVGYLHLKYDKYENVHCGDLLASGHYNYVGPTKLALNIAYVFGRQKAMPTPPAVIVEPPVVQPYQPDYRLAFRTPQAEAEKARHLSGRAFLDFVVNKTDIRPDYRGNAAELAKVLRTIDVVRNDPNTTITHISIHGYASPEGSYQNNVRLAQGRAQAFRDYVQSLIQLPDAIFSVKSTPEDWQGLIDRLEGTGHEHILAIAKDSQMAPDQKEQLLKRQMPKEWRVMLNSIFPALRHSDYEVSYTIRPFTVDEARELIRTKPQQLSLNEMFLVANTYEPGSQDYNDVFETAVRMYPDDETANLNAAVIALQKNDLAAARRYLQKAGSSPEALNARAIMAIREHRFDDAEQLLRQCDLPEAVHNLGEMEKTRH